MPRFEPLTLQASSFEAGFNSSSGAFAFRSSKPSLPLTMELSLPLSSRASALGPVARVLSGERIGGRKIR